ncbi:MAG: hypothetical protein HDR71_17830 [Lachnospiraceae bacterium]|nr:hypothetical protein [Lachnospiraceae bacterium]
MRKNILFMTMAVALCVSALSGCQKVPETSESNGIQHAQGANDQQISGITAETSGQRSADDYEGTIGTTNNQMNISAQIPAIPENVYQITLKPNDNLDMDRLTAFLDSASGNIVDTSEELGKELEANEIANTTGDEPVFYSLFGDHSALELSDGNKTASFTHHTWGHYVDSDLREKCLAIFRGDTTTTLITPDKMGDGSFSAEKAAEILLEKLKAVGVSEIAFDKIYYNEGSDYSYYEFQFSPAYNGIKVDIGYNSYSFGQVSPTGFAFVSMDGVADLSLMDFLGKAVEKEPVEIISFDQVAKILEQYLDSGMIEADGTMTYNRAELKYYPVPNPAPKPEEIEYKPELVLIPIWHIYMPLDDYIDGHYAGPSTICINAITGELIND